MKKEVAVYLRDGEFIQRAYQVKVVTNKFSQIQVIGFPGSLLHTLETDSIKVHYHFNYPENGHYHHTVNLKDKHFDETIHVYYDKITSIKTIKRHDLQQYQRINEIGPMAVQLLDQMVHIWEPKPFATMDECQFTSTYNHVFQGHFPLGMGKVKASEMILDTEFDLVVDSKDYINAQLHYGGLIKLKGTPRPYEGQDDEDTKTSYVEIPLTERLNICLYCNISDVGSRPMM